MTATATLIGNVVKEIDLRFTQGGAAVATVTVAVNRRWQQNNEWREETSYLDVVCWGQLAENVATSVAKGDRVVVHGRLQQRTWEQEGKKRSAVEVVADSVAVDLRFATAQVERNERASTTNRGDE